MADVIVRGWELPDNCFACPFVHVVVANAGHGSFIRCEANQVVYPVESEIIQKLQKVRADTCPCRVTKDE